MRAVILHTKPRDEGRESTMEVVSYVGKRHLTTKDETGREWAWLMPSGVSFDTPGMRVVRVETVAP